MDCDPGKLASAARLPSETTLPIKWIAARVQIGTAKGAKSVLRHLAQSQDQRKAASALELCALLEFQSTVSSLRHLPLTSLRNGYWLGAKEFVGESGKLCMGQNVQDEELKATSDTPGAARAFSDSLVPAADARITGLSSRRQPRARKRIVTQRRLTKVT